MNHGSWSKTPLPSNWQSTRRRILQRDRERCRVCNRPGFEVDHIVPRRLGGSNEDKNLWVLCREHHAAKTGKERADGTRAFHAKKKKPPEKHPGLRTEDTHDNTSFGVQ